MSTKKDDDYSFIGVAEIAVFLFGAIMVAAMNVYLVIILRGGVGVDSQLARVAMGEAVFTTIVYAFIVFILARRICFEKFYKYVLAEADEMYFHGANLRDCLVTGALLDMQSEDGFGIGMCYELSALAMILLRDYRAVRLCRGEQYCDDDISPLKHSWVEACVPLNGWVVVDFAWRKPCVCSRSSVFRRDAAGHKMIYAHIYSYEDFWAFWFADALWRAARSKQSSHILQELSLYQDIEGAFRFRGEFYAKNELANSDGTITPLWRHDDAKWIATDAAIMGYLSRAGCAI